MSGFTELAQLVSHEEARLTGATCSCGCCRAGVAAEEAADRAAGGQGGKRQRRKLARRRGVGQQFPAPLATPRGAGGRDLPGWQGWSAPVTLSALLRLGAKVAEARRRGRPITFVPGALQPFFRNGHALYRVSTAGRGRGMPLSIGQVTATSNVARRMRQHAGVIAGGDPKVTAALKGQDPRKVLVQFGRVNRDSLNARLMHAYEIWLQDRERIRLYEPNTRTFDEFDPGWVRARRKAA